MGNLTDDMARLRGEIDELRIDRGAMIQALSRGVEHLASSVSTMRVEFGASHADMARRSKKSRAAFVSAMTSDVNALLGDCRKTRGETAVEDSNRRTAFCAGLQESVAEMCKHVADDLAGVRLLWRGRGAAGPRRHPLPKVPTTVVGVPPVVGAANTAEALPSREKTVSVASAEPAHDRVQRVHGGTRTSNPAKKAATRSTR